MVAKTVELPNIRKMFIPDPDFILLDADLKRADAQVVAWEADDEELKQIFREGLDIHNENARAMYRVASPTYAQRQNAKTGCHAANYGVSARTLAGHLNCTVHEADQFLKLWFAAHPKIKAWQDRIFTELRATRTVWNKFGFRRYYFDRIDRAVLGEALAWCPQSTVALVTDKGMVQIERTLPEVQLLLQVHDSVVMQVPKETFPDICYKIRSAMEILVPYDDPLVIPVSMAFSDGSWGHLEEFTFADAA